MKNRAHSEWKVKLPGKSSASMKMLNVGANLFSHSHLHFVQFCVDIIHIYHWISRHLVFGMLGVYAFDRCHFQMSSRLLFSGTVDNLFAKSTWASGWMSHKRLSDSKYAHHLPINYLLLLIWYLVAQYIKKKVEASVGLTNFYFSLFSASYQILFEHEYLRPIWYLNILLYLFQIPKKLRESLHVFSFTVYI